MQDAELEETIEDEPEDGITPKEEITIDEIEPQVPKPSEKSTKVPKNTRPSDEPDEIEKNQDGEGQIDLTPEEMRWNKWIKKEEEEKAEKESYVPRSLR